MPERKPLSTEDIKRLYWNEGMTTYQIGAFLGYKQSTIHKFMKRHNLSTRGHGGKADKPWNNADLLRKLYWDEELNLKEIGVQVGCCAEIVNKWMKRYGIPRRTTKECALIAVKRGRYDKLKTTATLRLNEDQIRTMYLDEKLSIPQIAKIFDSTTGSLYHFMLQRCIPTRTWKQAAALRSGEKSPNWKGGRYKRPSGYIEISASNLTEHERALFKPMIDARNRYAIDEHRLVMARKLNRSLRKEEVVHHFNGVKDDNRFENLLLLSDGKHRYYIPVLQKRIRELEKRISKLEADKQLYLDMTGG